jgi:hypothetical protein
MTAEIALGLVGVVREAAVYSGSITAYEMLVLPGITPVISCMMIEASIYGLIARPTDRHRRQIAPRRTGR